MLKLLSGKSDVDPQDDVEADDPEYKEMQREKRRVEMSSEQGKKGSTKGKERQVQEEALNRSAKGMRKQAEERGEEESTKGKKTQVEEGVSKQSEKDKGKEVEEHAPKRSETVAKQTKAAIIDDDYDNASFPPGSGPMNIDAAPCRSFPPFQSDFSLFHSSITSYITPCFTQAHSTTYALDLCYFGCELNLLFSEIEATSFF